MTDFWYSCLKDSFSLFSCSESSRRWCLPFFLPFPFLASFQVCNPFPSLLSLSSTYCLFLTVSPYTSATLVSTPPPRLPLSLSLSFSISYSFTISLSLSLSYFPSQSLSRCHSLSLTLSQSLSLTLLFSLLISLSLYLSFFLSLSLFLFLSQPSFTLPDADRCSDSKTFLKEMLEETSIAEVRLIDANEKMEGLAPHVESLEVTLLDIEVRTEVHWDFDLDFVESYSLF